MLVSELVSALSKRVTVLGSAAGLSANVRWVHATDLADRYTTRRDTAVDGAGFDPGRDRDGQNAVAGAINREVAFAGGRTGRVAARGWTEGSAHRDAHAASCVRVISRETGVSGYQVDRAHVVVAASQGATELVVEVVGIAAGKTAVSGGLVAKLECHLVHEAEHAAARGPGEPYIVRFQAAEGVGGQVLRAQLGLNGRHEVAARRAEIRGPDALPEDRVQASSWYSERSLPVNRPPRSRSALDHHPYRCDAAEAEDLARDPSRQRILFVRRAISQAFGKGYRGSLTMSLHWEGLSDAPDHPRPDPVRGTSEDPHRPADGVRGVWITASQPCARCEMMRR